MSESEGAFSIVADELHQTRATLERIETRVYELATSLSSCQAACTTRATVRAGWLRWVGAAALAILPATAVWFLKLKGR